MATVEERVVGMRFDSSKFNSGIKPAIDGLDKLKESLNLKGATKALDELDSAGKRFTLGPLGVQIDSVSTKFIAMATVGITALTNIANKAINAGSTIIKSLTVDPINAGLKEYEMNLNAIQTILASTKSKGENLGSVNDALNELNAYSDKTIYNFGQMVQGIKTLTTTGADLQESVAVVKGFANAAALAGVGAEEMARALQFGLNQAISKGRMMTQDWMSLETSGIASETFKNSLMETARVNGIAVDDIIKKNGSFRESLSEGWLTSDILQQTLAKFTGDMSDEQLRQQGYTEQQIKDIQELAKTAVDSATKVKTFSQLLGTLQEAAGSGWSKSFQIIIGDFEQAKELWTNVNNTIGAMINQASDARNKILQDWADNGGREAAINAISSAFKILMSILGPIKDAFNEVFPPVRGKQLADITKNIQKFVESLKPGKALLDDIKSTAKGFFALLSIGAQIIGGFIGMIWDLLGVVAPAGGGLLDFTGKIGEFLVKVDTAIKKGDGLKNFFEGLGNVIKVPIEFLGKLLSLLGDFWEGFWESDSALDTYSQNMENRFQPLVALGEFLKRLWNGLGAIFRKVAEFFAPLAGEISDLMGRIGPQITDAIKNMKFNSILDILNTGLLGGLLIIFKKFTGGFTKIANDGLGVNLSFVDGLKDALGGLTGYLKAMQDNVRADTIMKIAIAVALLAASAIGLSLVDSVKLAAALGAMTVMFGQLIGALALLEKVMGAKGFARMPFLTASLVLLAGAILILSVALLILSTMDWDEVARGLTALAGAMAIVTGAAKLLPANLILTGPGLAVAAAGILLLAIALKVLSTLSWDDIGRSLTVLGGALVILAIGLTAMVASIPGAAALVIASVGLIALAVALKILSTLSWDDIGRAMVALGGALVILAVGLTLMIAAIPGAAALLIASVALIALATALKIMASLGWEEIWKALILLGGALGILAVGLTLMIAALPGAAALLVAAGALVILAIALKAMGSMPWDQIGTGLATMAIVLALIVGAGYALAPVVGTLFLFGAAMLLIGLAALAAGAGIMALGIGLTALGVAGAAGTAGLVALITGIVGLLPMIAEQIGLALVALAVTIGEAAPQLVGAILQLLSALLVGITEMTPEIITFLGAMVLLLCDVLINSIPALVDAGLKMLLGILQGIADNIGQITEVAFDIVIAFIDAIAKKLPEIIDSAAKLVISFIDGIGEAVKNNSSKFVAAGSKLFRAIVDGVAKAIEQGGSDLAYAGSKIGNALLNGAKKALGIASPSKEFKKVAEYSIAGLVNEMADSRKKVEGAGEDVGDSAINGVQKSFRNLPKTRIDMGIDTEPVIRPVLDLTLVKRDAGLISGILNGPAVIGTGTRQRAEEISTKYGEYQQEKEAFRPDLGTKVLFTQNNYSPKALPAVEIYRQTNNQMSILKGELEKKDA